MVNDLVAVGRAIRRAPERFLHAARRRRVLRRLSQRAPGSILVVCHGNICRSPFAAALLRRGLGPDIRVDSAGWLGPSRPSPSEAVVAASAYQVDLSPHRSTRLSAELVRDSDLIVVMEPRQEDAMLRASGRPPGDIVVLGDLDPLPIDRRAIDDPVNGPVSSFVACYARIDRCVRELVRTLHPPRLV